MKKLKAKDGRCNDAPARTKQITKLLNILALNLFFYHELFQNEPQNFQEWFNNAYFVQDAGALTQPHKQTELSFTRLRWE